MSSGASDENYAFQKIIVIVGFSLMAMKFFAYYLTDSVSILTDALESIVNVIAGCVGLYALYLSARPADKTHPFGHGRVELISASIEGSMILVAGMLIVFEAIMRLMNPTELRDLDIGIVLIAFAALVNFLTGRAAISKGRKNRSVALEASGKHLCTDTLSSVGIILGLGVVCIGSYFQYDVMWLDPILALLFGVLIMTTGARVIKGAADDIMDKADRNILDSIVCCLTEYRAEEWIDIHHLRTIKYGTTLHIEMHMTLPFSLTIEEAFRQKEKLANAIEEKFGDSVDLMIMPEPCHSFSCMHCSLECTHRRAEFITKMQWNIDTLSQDRQHALCNRVFIDNLIEK